MITRPEKSMDKSKKCNILASIFFNMYTNNQPIMKITHHFLYAYDLALILQEKTFNEVEQTLTNTFEKLDRYCTQNSLKPNPTKTQN